MAREFPPPFLPNSIFGGESVPTKEELLIRANELPVRPGVYIMKDKNGKVIYVGKSAKLKNRVSQYFQNGEKNVKTAKMVASVYDFEHILCDSEIEALSLENSLIKQYAPRYNIRLKDSKSYPYIKITAEEYPRLVFTRSRLADKGRYFGPFTGTSTVFSLMSLINKTLGIPSCKLKFPRDIGKGRECLYYQMKQCCGPCRGDVTREEYGELIRCAADILRGKTKNVIESLEKKMYEYAENEQFEAAARCRDSIYALQKTKEKQKIVDTPNAFHDVIALYQDELCFCISVFMIREGVLVSKNDYVFGVDKIMDEDALTAFLVDYYRFSDNIPPRILLHESVNIQSELLSGYISQNNGANVTVKTDTRGDAKKLCELVYENAREKAQEYINQAEKDNGILLRLASLLSLESLPERIEAYDISNLGDEHKTAGMVVYEGGKAKKADYRTFTIKGVRGSDDYACMREALSRRASHLSDESGSMSFYPDLILLDGGRGHVSTVKELFSKMGVDIPVFGMVKDDFHKTRALCTENEEISIAKEQGVYNLIYRIQEEVHRYTVSRMKNAKSNTLKRSSLEKIKGIGASKSKALLLHFGGISGVKNASIAELCAVSGIRERDANEIRNYFDGKEKK